MSIAHLGLADQRYPAGDQRPAAEGWQGERTPPHDLLAEQSAIGGMLLSKDAVADVVETVRGVDFYIPKHEVIFEAMLDALLPRRADRRHRGHRRADQDRASCSARAAPSTCTPSPGLVPTAANAGYYASIVAEKAVLRRLVEAGTRIVQMGYASEGEVVDLVNNAQAEIYGVTGGVEAEDYVPLVEAINTAVDEIERGARPRRRDDRRADRLRRTRRAHQRAARRPADHRRRPSRPRQVDARARLRPRGRRSSNDLPTIFFSLEMGRSEIAMRLLSAEATIG